jgi:hypothetical protein
VGAPSGAYTGRSASASSATIAPEASTNSRASRSVLFVTFGIARVAVAPSRRRAAAGTGRSASPNFTKSSS